MEWAKARPWLRLANPKVQRKSPSRRRLNRDLNAREFYASTPKNGREFDAQVFLDTISEGRKAILFPKKQTIFAPLASKYSVDVVILDYCMQ